MRKILFFSVILAMSSLVFASCNNTTTNTNLMSANRTANGTTNSNANANANKEVSSDDKEFMNKAAQGGMAEVKLGELASTKAQNPDVKAFGQKMVTDHGKANDELKAIAARKNVTLPTDVNAEQKETYDKLSKLSGAEFDKEYVKTMVDDHQKDLDEFKDEADDGDDADVKAFAAKYAPVIQSHLDMIKGIQDKMK